MERLKNITIIFLLAIGSVTLAASAKPASVLLQEGLFAEEIEGDLDTAIKIYERITADPGGDQRSAARAAYRTGMCYAKKGEKPRAAEQFRNVVSNFAEQTTIVARARGGLRRWGAARRSEEAEVAADGRPVKGGGNSVAEVVPPSLHENLVLYYSFDSDDDPETVVDISGMGNHGQVHGAKYTEDEILGGAMAFDGDDDYISVTEVSLKEFSFSAWVKTEEDGINNRRIFLLSDGEHYYSLEGNTRDGISVYVTRDSETTEYDWQFRDNVWTHITVTYDGTKASIYINSTLTEAGRAVVDQGVQGTTYIGGIARHNGGFWDGMIDEVAIFGRALAADEVEQLFSMTGEVVEAPEAVEEPQHFEGVVAGGRPVKGGDNSVAEVVPAGLQTNLALYYSFYSDSDPDKVVDISGRGLHGQVQLNPEKDRKPEYAKDDVLGGAMHFEDNGQIVVQNVYLKEFTFSAWVAPTTDDLNNRRIFLLSDGRNCYALQGNVGEGVGVYVADGVEVNEYNWRLVRDRWTHITVTHDGRDFAIYRNGQLTEIGTIQTQGVTGTLYIGGTSQHNGDHWRGLIDEVAVFNRALTAEEVEQLFSMTGEMVEASQPAEESRRTRPERVRGGIYSGEAPEKPEESEQPEKVADGYPVKGGESSVTEVVPWSLRDNLVLYYSFYTDDNPETVVDISGMNRNGQVRGATYAEDEILGGVMSFDGDDDYISLPDIGLKEFSFSAWVKTQGDGINNRRIFMLDEGELYYTVEGNTRGGVSVYVTEDMQINEYDWQFARETWTHITVTYDATTLNIYKNGRLTETGGSNFTFAKVVTGEGYIGGIDSHNGGYWHGMIDEAALFNRALTSEEVEQLYSMTGAAVESE